MTSIPGMLWKSRIDDAPVALDSAGEICVVVGSEGEVRALSAIDGTLVSRTRIDGGLVWGAVDPRGHRVVLTGPFGAWLWEPHTGSLTSLSEGQWCARAYWVSEERFAVAIGRCIAVFDRAGDRLWTSDQFASTVTDLAWLGGWHKLAVASYGGVNLVEPRSAGVVTHMPFKGSLLDIAASPNGRWIVSGNQDSTLQVFRSDKDTRLEMEGYPFKISRVAFDSMGRYLANDGAPEVSVWDFGGKGPRGRAPVLLTSATESEGADIADFAWHPSQAMLAVGWDSGEVLFYLPSKGTEGKPLSAIREVLGSGPDIRALHWHADPLLLLVADSEGSVFALDVDEKGAPYWEVAR